MADMVMKAMLVADATGYVSGMKKAQTATKGVQTSAQKAAAGTTAANKKTAAGFSKIQVAGAAAALAIAAYARGAIKAASDQAESINKSKVVFGENSAAIEEWSSTAATQMGMTSQSALEAASTFGNLFTAMDMGQDVSMDMSRNLVQLSADLGSFNNIDPTIATNALRSGLVGQTRPLKTLGVNLTQATVQAKAMEMGLMKTAGAISPAARAQASYALILEQTTNAQGDFERTSGDLPNSSKILSAQWKDMQGVLGKELLPAMKGVIFVSMKLLSGFSALPKPIQTAAGALVVFGAAAMMLGPRLMSVVAGMKAVVVGVGSLKALAIAVRTFGLAQVAAEGAAVSILAVGKSSGAAVPNITKLGIAMKALGVVTLVVAAQAALMHAMDNIGPKAGAATLTTDQLVRSLSELAANADMSADSLANTYDSAGNLANSHLAIEMVGGLSDSLAQMSDDANGTTGGLRGLVLGYQDFTNGLVGADSALDDSREGIKNIDTALAQMASSGQAVEAAKALEEMKEAIADRGGNVDGFVDSLGGYEEALAKAADEQAKFNEELEQFQTLTSMATSLSFAEDMRSLQSALKESGGAMGYGEEGAKSLGIALKMATGFGEGFNKELENLKQSGQDSAESIAAAGAKYVKMGTDFAATIPNTQKGREVIDGLNEAMADVPNWVPVQVSLTGGKSADKQIKKIAQSIGMTPKQLQLSIAENGGKPTEAQIKRIAKATGMKQKDILIAIGLTGAPKAVGEAGKAGKQTGSAAAKGAASTKGEALASGKTLGTATAKGAASTVGEARDTGQQVGNALNTGTVAGIQQSVGSAIAAAASAGARVAQAYKDAAKVKSPSQVTIYVGQMLNAGLVRGIQSSGQAAVNAAHGVVNSVSGVYSSAAQASAVAVAEQWASFHESARVEGMNTERFKKKIKKKDRVKGKKNWEWATRNTGRGDAWKAGRDAAKSYAEGIANAAQEAAKAAAQLRVRTAEALTSSGRGDFTQAKSSGSAKAWIARQLKMVLGFKKNLQTLASAGLPQYMLQDMIARGVDAAPLAASLVRADAATFNQIASQGAALQLASQNLGAVGSSLYLDRQASMGVKAAPGSQPGSIAVYIGGQKINEIVGVEVDGQVKQLANQVVYG